MLHDGTQYDLPTFPWHQASLLEALEASLAAADAATTPEERERHRSAAEAHNRDLVMLHGIDLGPF